MAVTIASTSEYLLANNSSAVSIAKPSGLQVGDLMIAIIAGRSSISEPAGWTIVEESSQAYSVWGIYKRIANENDVQNVTSWSFNTGAAPGGGKIFRIPKGDFYNVQLGTGAITPNVNSNLVFLMSVASDNDSDETTFSGYSITGASSPAFTETFDNYGLESSYRVSMGIAYANYDSTTQISAFNITLDQSPDENIKRIILVGEKLNVSTVSIDTDVREFMISASGSINHVGLSNIQRKGFASLKASSGDISIVPLVNPSFNLTDILWIVGAGTLVRSTEQALTSYSGKLSWSSGNEAYAEQHFESSFYRGKTITFGCWIYNADPTKTAFIVIYDHNGSGYEPSYSSAHTGNSTWQFLTCKKTIRSDADDVFLRISLTTSSAASAYFDDAIAFVSSSSGDIKINHDIATYLGASSFSNYIYGLDIDKDYRAVAFAQNEAYTECGLTLPTKTLKNPNKKFRPLSQTKFINDANLVSYYPLTSNADDYKNAHNGTATDVTYTSGKFGNAATFNGTSSKIDTGYSFDYPERTFIFWAKWENSVCLCSRTANNVQGFDFWTMLGFANATGIRFTTSSLNAESNKILGIINDGKWHHFAIRFSEANNAIYFFIDGILRETIAITGTITDTANLFIGYRPTNIAYGKGQIQDLAIFDRSVTWREIYDIYAGVTLGEYPINQNTKLYMSMNAGAFDKSVNGFHGTLKNVIFGDVNGKFGEGALFNTLPSYIDNGTSIQLGTGDFTISLWMNSTQAQTENYFPRLVSIETTGFPRYAMNLISYGTTIYSQCFFEIYSNDAGVNVIGVNVRDGKWHNIVATKTSNAITIYVDGKKINSASHSLGTISNNSVATIGSSALGAYAINGQYTGKLDEVIIEDGAWSQSKVAKYYQSSRAMFGV